MARGAAGGAATLNRSRSSGRSSRIMNRIGSKRSKNKNISRGKSWHRNN